MYAGCKENHFYSLSSGQAEASIYQPRRHFNQPQKLFVLLLFKFLIKHHLPVGQVKNRIHQPDSKIHQPWAIGHCFLCTLCMSRGYWCFKSLLFSSHYLVLDRWILAKLCFVRPIKFHDLACFERTFCTKIAYQGDLTVV